jgi:hypothetical protein
MFFNSHICNEYCKYLGLINPRDQELLPTDFKILKEIRGPED